jgi:hypothetical protein
MKKTLSTSEAAYILAGNREHGFSYSGARALVEYLEELEQDTGEDIEFDAVAIRCDWAEYESLQDWAADYHGAQKWMQDLGVDPETEQEAIDEAIREYIRDRGQLVEFDGGIIVSAF